MFDLNQEIAQWRRTMAADGIDDPAVLDELESHLRDSVAQQLKAGGSLEPAFRAAVARLGGANELKREFALATTTSRFGGILAVVTDRRRSFRVSVALAALVALGFYCRQALVTPVYEAQATVQVMRRPAQSIASRELVTDNDIRTAEDLNTTLRIIVSARLRAEVMTSLNPAERKIVGRTASANPAQGDMLGLIKVWPQRLSLVVTIAVDHEDAEAAALIANRYAELSRRFVALGSHATSVSIRTIDPATPPLRPIAPNLSRIFVASLLLGGGTFAGLMAITAVLRRILRTPIDLDPQTSVS